MLKLLFLIEHQSKFCAYLEFLRKSESAHLNGGFICAICTTSNCANRNCANRNCSKSHYSIFTLNILYETSYVVCSLLHLVYFCTTYVTYIVICTFSSNELCGTLVLCLQSHFNERFSKSPADDNCIIILPTSH